MTGDEIFEQAHRAAKALRAAEQDLVRALTDGGIPKPIAEKLSRKAVFDFIEEKIR